jgi:hypothetical protein
MFMVSFLLKREGIDITVFFSCRVFLSAFYGCFCLRIYIPSRFYTYALVGMD